MIPVPTGTKIWVACGPTDMRRGFDGLAMMVQDVLKQNPFGGHLFVFRGKRADRIKVLWWDGTGLCLYAKRLERSLWGVHVYARDFGKNEVALARFLGV